MISHNSLPRLLSIALLSALCVLAADGAYAEDLVLTACNVTPEDEAKIPAEEAGVLLHLAIKQGSQLTAGQLIGKIDDQQATLQRDAAKSGWQSAFERYKSDIEIRYAEKNSLVAKAAYDKMLAANKGMPNSVTALEILKAKLEWDTAELQIEKATKDRSIAKYDMGSKEAEYNLGELGIKRRAIVAPFNGVVDELYRHQSEWVNPGDPILHMMGMDTMRVEQDVEQSQYDPQDIYGCKVTVVVDLARGRKETFPGRVTFVSPVLKGTSRHLSYLVRAEVANRNEAGIWLLRPNHQPTMTIHLGTASPGGPEVGRLPNQK